MGSSGHPGSGCTRRMARTVVGIGIHMHRMMDTDHGITRRGRERLPAPGDRRARDRRITQPDRDHGLRSIAHDAAAAGVGPAPTTGTHEDEPMRGFDGATGHTHLQVRGTRRRRDGPRGRRGHR